MRTAPIAALLAPALLVLPLAACVPAAGPAAPRQPATPAAASAEARGLAFARENCAGCHAVSAPGLSPNPEAPPFEAVVAASGLTRQTLSTFLRDRHNFPGAMAFAIDGEAIDDLTAYMLTLRPAR